MPARNKIFCFGEILLRISPSADNSWIDNASLPVYIGGAELNVARALANWNVPVSYCTAIPDNTVARHMLQYLDDRNIDTSSVHFSGERIGLYYMTQGADLKHAGVIYDRAWSSFSALKPGMINWEEALTDVSWFHFSAITPAISQDLADVCEEGLKVAVQKNIKISVDLNYRAKLWKYGKQPDEVMPTLAKYCNVIMGNIWAAHTMLNIPMDQSLIDQNIKDAYVTHAAIASETIMRQYPACHTVANTFRFTGDHDTEINYYAVLYNHDGLFKSTQYHAENIVDKAGTGDCFMAGLIYADHHHFSNQQTIDYAAAAAFSKFFIIGDATSASVHEIENTIGL